MIEWWGPILQEDYGGSELNGLTYIDSSDWLEHRGCVGRAMLGTLHICDEAGTELPPGENGIISFEREEIPLDRLRGQASALVHRKALPAPAARSVLERPRHAG